MKPLASFLNTPRRFLQEAEHFTAVMSRRLLMPDAPDARVRQVESAMHLLGLGGIAVGHLMILATLVLGLTPLQVVALSAALFVSGNALLVLALRGYTNWAAKGDIKQLVLLKYPSLWLANTAIVALLAALWQAMRAVYPA